MYKFPTPQDNLKEEWVLQLKISFHELLKGWWINEKAFRTRDIRSSPTKYLRNPYRIIATLCNIIYEEYDVTLFKESRVPLIHLVTHAHA